MNPSLALSVLQGEDDTVCFRGGEGALVRIQN